MPKLADKTIARIEARKKSLDAPQHELAPLIGVHYNTLSRALQGHSVNRNNARKLEEFANGDIAAAEAVIELSALAAEQLRKFAAHAKVDPGEWESALHYWISTQSPQFRRFIQESVDDAIQAARMPAIAILRKGGSPASSLLSGAKPEASTASSSG